MNALRGYGSGSGSDSDDDSAAAPSAPKAAKLEENLHLKPAAASKMNYKLDWTAVQHSSAKNSASFCICALFQKSPFILMMYMSVPHGLKRCWQKKNPLTLNSGCGKKKERT